MILVTGATGTVGRELVRLLLDDGQKVAAVTRNPSSAGAIFPDGVQVVSGDPSRPATLSTAMSDADAVFVNPVAVGDAAAEFMTSAAGHGVQRAVLLSGLAVEYGAGDPLARHFGVFEDAVKDSGVAWTLLRPGDFAANALAWAEQIRSVGTVYGPYGDAATSAVHERDIAAVAARALTEPGHDGQAYPLTGSQSLTQREKLRIIATAVGRDLSFVEIPRAQALAAITERGIPEAIANTLLDYQADSAREPGPTTDTVARVLGRPALTFTQWAAEHAAAFTG